jgi:hypothetical protein
MTRKTPYGFILAILLVLTLSMYPMVSASYSDNTYGNIIPQTGTNNINNSYTTINNTYINQSVNATVNTTQFDSANPITIKESWISSLWCKLTGCTMSGNLNVNGNLTSYEHTPATTNTYSIGSSTLRWLKGWFSGLDVAGNINQTSGNATINMIYGEMYCKNDTGCGVIDLVTSDVYVAMRNQTAGNNNGFTLTGASNLTAQHSGIYKAEAKVAVTAGSPAGEYGMKLYVNETGQNNCYDHFHVGADQVSMVITCLVRANAGQNISIRFDDHASPVTDLTVYASNLNLLRIGN